jgi:hypothetical protein
MCRNYCTTTATGRRERLTDKAVFCDVVWDGTLSNNAALRDPSIYRDGDHSALPTNQRSAAKLLREHKLVRGPVSSRQVATSKDL